MFAERHGLVLVNAQLLQRICSSLQVGDDLLTLFTSSEIGATVCRRGAVVPVIGLAQGGHDVSVRNTPPSMLSDVRKTSTGWVLRAGAAPTLLCGLGYLSAWDPEHVQHRKLTVPSGLYAIEFSGGFSAEGRWGIDFLVTPTDKEPDEPPGLEVAFDLYLDGP